MWCILMIFIKYKIRRNIAVHSHSFEKPGFFPIASVSFSPAVIFYFLIFVGQIVLALFFLQSYIVKLLCNSIICLRCVHEFHT